jgi:hypothetical protein
MKTLDVSAIVNKDGHKVKRISKSFNSDEPLTVEHIKGVIKSELGLPFEIVKEEFYYMSKELKDTDTAPFKSGNEFILTIK